MTPLQNTNVIIVDRVDAGVFDLSLAFKNVGAQTHIVADLTAAIAMVSNKKIDAVLVRFARDPDTIAFCKKLSELSVPYVFTGEPAARYSAPKHQRPDILSEIQQIVADHLKIIANAPTLH